MNEKEKDYAKKAFDDVSHKYHKIEFFKISACYVLDIIKEKKEEGNIDVLDVACGTGNVVLKCASCMPESKFDAMDISESMITKAELNARSLGLENTDFYLQDITKLNISKKYDVITCSYVLFFLPKAHIVLHTLTKLLTPKGFVVFTSFLDMPLAL